MSGNAETESFLDATISCRIVGSNGQVQNFVGDLVRMPSVTAFALVAKAHVGLLPQIYFNIPAAFAAGEYAFGDQTGSPITAFYNVEKTGEYKVTTGTIKFLRTQSNAMLSGSFSLETDGAHRITDGSFQIHYKD